MISTNWKITGIVMLGLFLLAGCSTRTNDPVQARTATENEAQTETIPKKADVPDGVEMVDYDTPPKPVGGFSSIAKQLKYPESARKANVQGRVLVWAQVSADGAVTKAKVGTSLNKDCDAAALEAIKAVKWNPAIKEEQAVDVWVAIPIEFKLH